jgi:hypothetical protein
MFSNIFNRAAKAATDVVDVATAVVTLGQYGELSRSNISRLVSEGVSVATLSEESGIAVEVIYDMLHNK